MDQRKLVVLGLPWDTTETTLHVRETFQGFCRDFALLPCKIMMLTDVLGQ